ncbi:MAG: hypothetical protein M5U01_06730 [Ardenticatenaceae bacterium]|nr:hypothetical protein [Ardenticatenaceae bacterium]HBY93308.1 hypothetical protein [Chloroflexota bacterium]
MRKVGLVAILLILLASSIPQVVLADKPANPNCWGVVTAQRALAEQGIGRHASSQSTPRLGLGNVARLFYELGIISSPHVSDLGTLLAALDEFEATHCP